MTRHRIPGEAAFPTAMQTGLTVREYLAAHAPPLTDWMFRALLKDKPLTVELMTTLAAGWALEYADALMAMGKEGGR